MPSGYMFARTNILPEIPVACSQTRTERNAPVGMMRQADNLLLGDLEGALDICCGSVEAEQLPVFGHAIHPPALGRQARAREICAHGLHHRKKVGTDAGKCSAGGGGCCLCWGEMLASVREAVSVWKRQTCQGI